MSCDLCQCPLADIQGFFGRNQVSSDRCPVSPDRPQPVSENPPPTEVEREAMLRLAEECEKTGRLERAEQLHQDRLVECESAKAWVEYAAFR